MVEDLSLKGRDPSRALVFQGLSIDEILKHIESDIHGALLGLKTYGGEQPSRINVKVLPPFAHPPKVGAASPEGRVRLLHNLANIELQAMELSLRSLMEFPEAPLELKEELAALALSEAEHLKLCLEELSERGYTWGHWPVHLALWETVDRQDTLLERLFIVHRYLEGSGLEAQAKIIHRLESMGDQKNLRVVKKIHHDEIGHVLFGSRWFHRLVREGGDHFSVPQLFQKLGSRLPRRVDPLLKECRRAAGFTDDEIDHFEQFRLHQIKRPQSPFNE